MTVEVWSVWSVWRGGCGHWLLSSPAVVRLAPSLTMPRSILITAELYCPSPLVLLI